MLILIKTSALALCMIFMLFGCGVQHGMHNTCIEVTSNEEADGSFTTESYAALIPFSDKNIIPDLLSRGSDLVKEIMSNSVKYETQILYTQINRSSQGIPQFRHFGYRVNPKAYFNPASLVKLPVVCLALQKINELNIPGLNRDSRIEIGRHHNCQKAATEDKTAPNGYPTVAHYIKKALLVSDNDAYNRLYEFLGQEYINASLWRSGYPTARIIRRFNGCNAEENRYTNPVTFYGTDNRVTYAQPVLVNNALLSNPLGNITKGKAHIDSQGHYVPQPFDYTYHNYICLQDMHTMLQSLFFPECFSDKMRFSLTSEDYSFLYQYLSSLPAESDVPAYHNRKLYPDNYKKYFLFGDIKDGIINDRSIRIFNIVGQSDGYLSDCAYIKNASTNIEFFLSAVIYVNGDEIIRDGKYEYNTVGLPFLAELGRIIYEYEKTRIRRIIDAGDLSHH